MDGHLAVSARLHDVPSRSRGHLACHELTKRYGNRVVVHRASLEFARGRVHALVGANGAGKSTILGMISGRVQPDAGTINLGGRPLRQGSPRHSREAGIATIYQELSLIPHLNAVANVFLGQPLARMGWRADRSMERRFQAQCARFELKIDPRQRVDMMPLPLQQFVEIMRATEARADVVLFDEPTASLDEDDRRRLFRILAQLKEKQVTIVFVSHNLDEVLAHSDDVTVMRDGEIVATTTASEWTRPSLMEAIAGKTYADFTVQATRSHSEGLALPDLGGERTTPALQASRVVVPGLIRIDHISVDRSEVLGLAGLMGAGRTTLLRALAGMEAGATGELMMFGTPVKWPRNVRNAHRVGISLVPEDRKHGLVMGMTVAENLWLGANVYAKAGYKARYIVSAGHLYAIARELLMQFGMEELADRVNAPVGSLSGGNQQKVLLAKWALQATVLLADEPTRGIDINAKSDVLAKVRALADGGVPVIIASSEFEDLLQVADRIAVIVRGELSTVIERDDPSWNMRDLIHLAFGHSWEGVVASGPGSK